VVTALEILNKVLDFGFAPEEVISGNRIADDNPRRVVGAAFSWSWHRVISLSQ
jgi:hypothetical protein